jgi:phospholipase/carboxylesterase
MPKLDGPRIAPTSGHADSLVVLLHGYGANGADLIALGQEWQPVLPRTAFVAPNAPETLPVQSHMDGLQWFPLTLRDPTEYWRGASAAGPVLEAFLAEELGRHGLPPERLALVGFSQGTMMALHVGLRRPAPAAIVGYSGMVAGPEHVPQTTGPGAPIMLIHGEADEVIPVEALDLTREALAERGHGVEWHRRPGLPHGIDPVGLALGGHFLASILRAH